MTLINEFKELFAKYKDRPILVYGDPDMDGLISMLLVCQFLDMYGLRYSYFVNDNRHHGFTLSPEVLQGYLVIAVDFDCVEELDSLVENDVVVLSLDHHEIQAEPVMRYFDNELRAIVINNQYPFEPDDNRYQSGAGVVYEALCEVDSNFISKEREALVGITLLSDIRPIENKKARAYLKTTYSADTTMGYIGYLVSSVTTADFGFGLPKMDRSFIDYTFSPRVNSLLRFGLTTEAINLILGKGLAVEGTKEKQSELVQLMKQRASYLDMSNFVAVGIDENEFSDCKGVCLANFIGLLASDVKGVGKSVLAFTYKNGEIKRASFRGRFDEVQYRQAFVDLGIDAQGHAGAFGILNFKPDTKTWAEINNVIGVLDAGHVQTVKIIDVSNLSFVLMSKGYEIATENCYVRDMYRTYLNYTGKGARIMRTTYKTVPFTDEDAKNGLRPDKTSNGQQMKYLRDADGEPIPKYIEYCVDGKIVKSFGVALEDGVILPIMEKGTIQLYIREKVC